MEDPTNQVIILSGGEPLASTRDISLPLGAPVIAADSGLHHADDLDLTVDLVIGDMDSVDAELLTAAVKQGSRTEVFPPDKDRTDLELAVDVALRWGATSITIVGAHTGRLDHFLGAMGLLVAIADRVDDLIWIDGSTRITVCVPGRTAVFDARPGDTVSLIPAGTDVAVTSTEGLRWSLDHETLPAGSTRGVSNVCDSSPISVSIEQGRLLIVHERTSP
ncbi:MAG: thiamine diphosphokinase [Actinomycetota bacterium]